MFGRIGVRQVVFWRGSARRSCHGAIEAGLSKVWFGEARQGGLGRAGQRGSSSDWGGIGMARLGSVTQTSKIVRKLCGGKTNGLFLEEDEAADH